MQLSGFFGHCTGIIGYSYAELQFAIQRCSRQVRKSLVPPAELSTLEVCTTHTGSLIALFCAAPPFSPAFILFTDNLGVDVLLLSCHMNEQYCCLVSKQGVLATEKFQRRFQNQKSQLLLSHSNACLFYYSQGRKLLLIYMCYSLDEWQKNTA